MNGLSEDAQFEFEFDCEAHIAELAADLYAEAILGDE
jgi:hypothetical protein